MQTPEHHAPLLVQAPVRALDPDGVGVITVGTAAFVLASVFCWIELNALVAAGQGWWLGVCVAGVGIGIVGIAISSSRHRRRKLGLETEILDGTPAREAVEPPKGG